MKKHVVKSFLAMITVLSFFSYCKKKDVKPEPVNLMPKVITTEDHISGTGTTRVDFVYDEQKRITALTGSFTSGGFTKASFEYNSDDKLTRAYRHQGTDITIYEFTYVGATPVKLTTTQAGTVFEDPITNPSPNTYKLEDVTILFNNQSNLISAVTDDDVTLAELDYNNAVGLFHEVNIPQPAFSIVAMYLGMLNVSYGAKNEMKALSAGELNISVDNTRDSQSRITGITMRNAADGSVLFEQSIAY